MPFSNETSTNAQKSTTAVQGPESGVQFVENKSVDPNGSQLLTDRCFAAIQNSWKSLVKIFQGNVFIKGHGNVSINAGHDVHVTAQNKQETTYGSNNTYNRGGGNTVKGELSKEHSKQVDEYTQHLESIDKAKMDAMKATKAEKVVCANCNQVHLVDDKSDNWSIILDEVRKKIDGMPYLQGPFSVLRWLVQKVYVALHGTKSNIDLNMGKGCGPGCDAGLRDGLSLKFQAGEEAAKKEMERLSETMNKLTANMPSNSSGAEVHALGYAFVFGQPSVPKNVPYQNHGDYHQLAMNLRVSDALRNKLRVTTEGNCKRIVYHPPESSPFGNLLINIQNNFKITSGNNGMDFISTGEIAIKGGSVHINGSQGEVSLTSGNLTTIGGANVLISADNKSGESGVHIDSKRTYIGGSFNVNGDSAMLGSLRVDGALSVDYINCPTMAAPSTINGNDNFVTHHSNWQYVAGGLNGANLALKLGTKFALQPWMLMLPTGILELFLEHYNIAMMSLPIEILPTGVFWGYSWGVGVGTCAGWIWNYPHNHTRTPEEHGHETPVPNGGYWRKSSGAGQANTAGNPAPTPIPTSGTYPKPGPRTWGGGCGGGGLYSKVRNQKYGINSDDAFNGGNYVTTTVVRNADGSIYPTPDLTYRYVKDNGSNATVDTNTGTVSYPLTGINC
jgi:hypothetical protein